MRWAYLVVLLSAGLIASAAHAQSIPSTMSRGQIVTADWLNQVRALAVGSPQLNGLGQVTAPIVGDVTNAPASAAGGSVVRTLADRFAEVTNVRDLIPYATGVDVTNAVQGALSKGETNLYFPPGQYTLCGLVVPSTPHLHIWGAGTSTVLLQSACGMPVFAWSRSAMAYADQSISNLSIDTTLGTAHAIDTTGQGGVTLDHLFFTNTPAGYDNIYVNGAGGTATHDVTIADVQVYSNAGGPAGHAQIEFGPLASDARVRNVMTNGAFLTQYGLVTNAGVTTLVVTGSHIYNLAKNSLLLNGCQNCQFSSNTWDNAKLGIAVITAAYSTFTNEQYEATNDGTDAVSLVGAQGNIFHAIDFGTAGTAAKHALTEDAASSYTVVDGAVVNDLSNWTNPPITFAGPTSYVINAPGVATPSQTPTIATGGTAARSLGERQGTRLEPQDFLTSGQTPAQLIIGQIDAEPAIQAAVATGKAITLPCGTYRLDEPFPDWSIDGIRLSGANMQCVTLNVNYTISAGSINVFHLSGHGQVISDMTINATRQMTAGALIYQNFTSQNRVHDLIVTGPFWNGIYIYGSNNTHIDHIYARPPYLASATVPNAQAGAAYAGSAFITLDGNVSTGQLTIDTYLSDLNIAQYQYGIAYIYASGIYESGIDVVGALNAHVFSPGTGENVNGIQAVNVLGDTSYAANWYFPASGGGVYEMMCSACWASSSYSGSGVVMANPNISQVHFENSTAINNSSYGVYISAGRNIGWIGGAIEMNNTKLGTSTDASDVYLSATDGTLDWIRVQDAFIGQGGFMRFQVGKTNQATYAVDLSAVPSTAHVSLTGLQTYGHSTGQFSLPGDATNILNANNQGN